ncbi:30S ribosomal protein S20 [Neisseria elongata]|uniref:30S ribosomal protein S20 n=1 Tax=Neisseria elongata TaxID=495 RepID=UPI00362157B4
MALRTHFNQSVKSELKTLVRHTREAVEAGDKDKAIAALRIASRKLDVAVSCIVTDAVGTLFAKISLLLEEVEG